MSLGTVLIVDDEETLRQSASEWLALSGFETDASDEPANDRAALAAETQQAPFETQQARPVPAETMSSFETEASLEPANERAS